VVGRQIILKARVLVEYAALVTWTIAAIAVVLVAPSFVYVVAVFTFGAIIAASLLIAWAAEASEASISRGLALAIVAIVQTIPEYFVEGTIAWKAGKEPVIWLHNVIANFTGANRLLTGFGWPLILLTVIIQRRRNRQPGPSTIALRREQSVEVVFMLGASLYYIWVLFQQELTIFDAIVWAGIFVGYMWTLARLPRGKEGREESLLGPSLAIAEIKSKRKKTAAVVGLFLFCGLTFVLITDSFVTSIQNLAQTFLVGLLGSGAVFFTIQWIAPVLSEFPEKVTAFNWARQITLAPLALLNFISSSVNELTALVALIPVVYFVSSGGLGSIPLGQLQWIEIFLTMSQSLYACASLLDLTYDVRNALVLLTLWVISTAIIEARLFIGVLFLILAALETLRSRGRITVFRAFSETVRRGVLRKNLN
jgi:cation:H+ antiporter